MTNYNERQDEILHDVYLAGWNDKLLDTSPTYTPDEHQAKLCANQALTSLTKELVSEAKPRKYQKEDFKGSEPDRRKKAFNRAIDQFEQNILKALKEEV